MSEQINITILQSDHKLKQPLRLEELLTLIKLASEKGYSIKDAKDMKFLYDARSSALYSVWFAIENDLPVFENNIPELIEFTGWQREQFVEDKLRVSSAC